MKQFILKNIVLVVILALTLVGSIVLIFFSEGKRRSIARSMEDIESDVQKLEAVNSARKPNSEAESETKIKADTDSLTKRYVQIYRHFGRPYRPALLKLIKNIASPGALKTDLPVDPSLVAVPKPKIEPEEGEDGEEEVAEAAPAEATAPTDEEKAVFNPASNLVVLAYDEDALRTMLADLYKDVHQEVSSEDDDGSSVIPDTIQEERALLFEKLFNQIIEAPEVVGAARTEDFRKAAAAKFAQAFALFREEVQELTLEDVTDKVAHELFLDALGLPRLMRQLDCKKYRDSLYEKYYSADIIPGLPSEPIERERLVQDLIYGKNLNRSAAPSPDNVIPIIRNFQIKEDLFRKMKEAGIGNLLSMNTGTFEGTPLDYDSESPVLVFTYTLEMTASMDAIDAFINSLQAAYKSDRVYIIKDIKLSSSNMELSDANSTVAEHVERAARGSTVVQTPQTETPADNSANPVTIVTPIRTEYALTDPHNPEYGKTLIGENRDEIKCTIVVDYLFYRADNITPQ